MTEDIETLHPDRDAWIANLNEHGSIHGYHRALGRRHGAVFTEDDETLLVSFETADQMRRTPVGLPCALGIAGREGWSQLCLYCEGDTFFRDEDVYRFFDELVDTGFFDQFERVVFFGAGPCGYAAASYSVTAPGATVFLIRPLATLDPSLAGWDRRYEHMRRADFTSRYGYAPDMIEAAASAYVIYDPEVPEDAMHAALFGLPEDHLLRCRRLGPAPERDLEQMKILATMLRAAGRGAFDASMFNILYRQRLGYRPYLNRILNRLQKDDRAGLCRHWANGIRARIRASESMRAAN